jgi:hypothetical protein
MTSKKDAACGISITLSVCWQASPRCGKNISIKVTGRLQVRRKRQARGFSLAEISLQKREK